MLDPPQGSIMRPWQRRVLVGVCVIWVVALGVLQYATGPEYALSILYLVAIMVATWYAGLRAGIVLSVLSALSWLLVDASQLERFSGPTVPLLNETFRFIVFLVVTFVLAKLHTSMQEVEALAMTDPLTGVPNRRAFFEVAGHLTTACLRSDQPVSLIFLDADNFKSINDTLGHQEGDELLRCAAATIQQHLRDSDLVARVGGDEFLVLLPNTGRGEAAGVTEKLAHYLQDAMDEHGWQVTFSFGVATQEEPGGEIHDLVRRADGLMYEAKLRPGKTCSIVVESAPHRVPQADDPGHPHR
jgi:diguanylate cyclase (GGDEF)-like protein